MSERRPPHKKIGEFLKQRREAVHESLAEVSGAVEIDLETLHKIESGRLLPSEDILLLLISHLNIDEQDAMQLLSIAGYDQATASAEEAFKQMFMLIPFDNRIMHVDDLQARADKNNVVIEFIQANMNGQKAPVSRIGMSKTQAKEMIETVRQIIERSEKPAAPMQLPARASRRKKAQK